MRSHSRLWLFSLAGFALALLAPAAHAQTLVPNEFFYQGRLEQSGQPASGSFDMRFELLTDAGIVLTSMCASAVPVADGLFNVLLSPGTDYAFFANDRRNLRVSVRAASPSPCQDPAGYTALAPMQLLTTTPLASRANLAAQSLVALTLNGQDSSYFRNPANLIGTIPNDKLSPSVVRTDVTNTFSQSNVFSQRVGIGAAASSSLLEVTGNQSTALLASTQTTNGSVLTLENRTAGLTTGNYVGAINFGLAGSTPGQIGYVRGQTASQDSIQFRAGGFSGVAIDGSARLGVGTLSPLARVHIASGTSGVVANPSTFLLIDTLGTNYFSMLTSNSEVSGVLFGRPAGGAADSGIIYNDFNVRGGLQFRTGGNVTRLTIDSAGTVIVPGTLSVGGVQYTSPKVSYKALGTGSFRSVGGGAAEVGLSGERLSGSGFSSLGTTLELPHGATITNITVYCFDNDGAGSLGIDLFATSFAGTFTSIRGTGTAGAMLGYQAIDVTPFTPYVVDNSATTLQLTIGMANLNPWTNALAILGARVTYTTPAAQ